MSESIDRELQTELRASDQPVVFDADEFARRVVTAISGRRRRQRGVVCVGLATVLAGLTVWGFWPAGDGRHSDPVDAQTIVRAQPESAGLRQTSPSQLPDVGSPASSDLDRIEREPVDLERQLQRFRELSEQLSRSQASLERLERVRQEQKLALLRAELSRDISVPELDRLSF